MSLNSDRIFSMLHVELCFEKLCPFNSVHTFSPHCRKHLRETLMVSNSNDLIKLTVCALVVLGQIFLSLGNTKVRPFCLPLVGLAVFVASVKIPHEIKLKVVPQHR